MRWMGRHHQTDDGIAQHSAPAVQQTVAAIRAGDPSAFDALVVAHYEPLLRLAFSYLGSRESAEEVVQDVFLRIWEQRAHWSPNGALRPYLFSAVRNGAFSQLRHRRLEHQLAENAASGNDVLAFAPTRENADDQQQTAELNAAIQAAIETLPPRTKEAFVLSRQQHLSHDEIARVMGTSVKTIQEQIGRALKALRIQLADWL